MQTGKENKNTTSTTSISTINIQRSTVIQEKNDNEWKMYENTAMCSIATVNHKAGYCMSATEKTPETALV